MRTLGRKTMVQQDSIEGWEVANHELDGRFLAAMVNEDVDDAMACFLDSSDRGMVLWGTEMRIPGSGMSGNHAVGQQLRRDQVED